MKDEAANKTDKDDPEVRRSSWLAVNSPISYENFFLPPETPFSFGQELFQDETPGYQSCAPHHDQARCKEEDVSLKKLNDFLVSRDCSPVRYHVRGMLSEAAERTKREHLRKVKQGIVAPGQEDGAWAELIWSGILDAQFNAGKIGRMEIEADRSILIANLRKELPSCRFCQLLSRYSHNGKFKIFSLKLQNTSCLISCGRGQPLPAIPKYRVGLTMPKIDHFIGFISSLHFVQDVAHGTRKLKLSSGETISMPNVVHNS